MVNVSIRSRKPTVCQLLHGMQVGGAEVLATRLARQLCHRYKFLFACLDELGTLGEELRRDGFRVEVLQRCPGLDWRCPVKLANLLRQERVDLVHAHQYTPFFYGMAARLLCPRPAVMFTEHGRHFPDYPRQKRIWANRLLLTKRDRVVGVGDAVRQALIDNEGISPQRVDVIYNGVDLHRFSGSSTTRADVRRELGVCDTDTVILQVARLDYLKDHATAIRTFSRVLSQRKNTWLVLVGEGPELAKIRALVEQSNLTQRVLFLGLRSDVDRLVSAADVFLLTSISEGIPVTLIEAMAAGVPIVSTNVGGVSEVVESGATGFLAQAGDDDALATHVMHLVTDGDLRRQMGMRGHERAWEMFSESQMHSGYLRLYEEMFRGTQIR